MDTVSLKYTGELESLKGRVFTFTKYFWDENKGKGFIRFYDGKKPIRIKTKFLNPVEEKKEPSKQKRKIWRLLEPGEEIKEGDYYYDHMQSSWFRVYGVWVGGLFREHPLPPIKRKEVVNG